MPKQQQQHHSLAAAESAIDVLRQDTGVCSMTTLMHRHTAIAYENAARLTSDHPRHRLLNPLAHHRLVHPKPDEGDAQNTNFKGTPPRPK